MRKRKDIPVEEATEKELLRWHMEQMAKESGGMTSCECASAMAELYDSFQNGHAFRFLILAVFFQLTINICVLVIELFRRKG